VIGSPMFIISNPKTVIEQCKSGIIGSMPALNARPVSQLDEWLAEITEELDNFNEKNPDNPAAPFAINQIVHRSNKRLEEDMELCEKYKVPILSLHLVQEKKYTNKHKVMVVLCCMMLLIICLRKRQLKKGLMVSSRLQPVQVDMQVQQAHLHLFKKFVNGLMVH